MFGTKRLEEENRVLREQLAATGAMDRFAIAAEIDRLKSALSSLRSEQAGLQSQIIETGELAILQEVGVYQYRHPLDDAEGYKNELARLRDQIRSMVKKDGGAVLANQDWLVNNSKVEGRRMVRDFSKLLLRAYNNEADNCVRTLKAYALDASIKRLNKSRETIARLGRTMSISISDHYHRVRVKELELTADYLAKAQEGKEAQRAERDRLREEQVAQREIAREQERLAKEQAHYTAAIAALRAKGDIAAAAEAELRHGEISEALEGLIARAANTRAGYVYVISNIGSLGTDIVKIGMTRRLEPLDRVRELGDASVPFRYDVHALIFSDDAVSLEASLHQAYADRRVNLVNLHREFFYAQPAEVKGRLKEFAGDVLQFVDVPEAVEWRQSASARPTSVAESRSVDKAAGPVASFDPSSAHT
ncbi:MAG: DUF4041 domain-containing protein [Actinomycetota bacterium]